MNVADVLAQLKSFENPNGKKILMRHGAREPFWGVRVGDMKKITKRIGIDHQLALDLYRTGNSDAMYLAGLIADKDAVTIDQLRKWVRDAYWYMLSEYTVAGLAAESPHGWELGLEWIDEAGEMIQTAGWATLGGVVSYIGNDRIDFDAVSRLLDRVEKTIHVGQNRVRYTMNNFVICVGAYLEPLSERARGVAASIGKVKVDMGGTSCKVPYAPDYIVKSIDHGSLTKKRSHIRC